MGLLDIGWHFPLLDHGVQHGINSSEIEHFNGSGTNERNFAVSNSILEALVKEMCQNAGDAHDGFGQPVIVSFQREDLPRNEIPGIQVLSERFMMCRKYADNSDESKIDKTALAFFDKALHISRKDSVSCLRVSDYNTTGAAGTDEDRWSNWHKLTRSVGTTNKNLGEGGSFGMGKSAALGASQFRTVYYSTLTPDCVHKFIGTSLLTAYKDDAGVLYQHQSYYGSGRGFSVTDKSQIPSTFLRKSVGLDTFITAFDFPEEWEEDIAIAVVNSFWPAIMWGKMEVIVGSGKKEIIIDGSNLPSLLSKFSNRSDAHIYHRAYTTGVRHTANTKMLGDSSAYIISGGDLPKKFAMVRKNGMIIEERPFNSRVPVAGVFECTNDTGNALLRRLEPPAHNKWLANRYLPDGPKIEKEFKRVVLDAIKEANSVSEVETGSVTGLEDLLPFDDPANRLNSKESKRPTEGLSESPKQTSSSAKIPRRPVMRKGKKNGSKVIIPITPRAIKTGPGNYTLKIENEGRTRHARVSISIAGDRDSHGVNIKSATDEFGNSVAVEDNSFGPVRLAAKSSFEIKIAVKRRVSLEVCAYET